MKQIHIDFETRSPVNLLTHGAYNYAQRAEILCMAYQLPDDARIRIWKPLEKQPFPEDLRKAIQRGDDCVAHNAEFERLIFDHCLPCEAPDWSQWLCSATLAAVCGLPRGLANLARCLHLDTLKDTRGKELIKLLCIPDAAGKYNEDPKLLNEMYAYCIQDVVVEAACLAALRQFTDDERDDYLVNLIINNEGLPIDTPLARAAATYATQERAALQEQISRASCGDLDKAAGGRMRDWVYERLNPTQQEFMHRYVDGNKKVALDRLIREELLELSDLPLDVREVVECSHLASKSSVAKFTAMANRAGPDGRARGAYLLNGAGQTGRYSSVGTQVHNMPRLSESDPSAVRAKMLAGEPIHTPEHSTMTVLSRMLRPSICAQDDRWFIWSDWSAIEGRVCPWLADDARAVDKLDLFAAGEDVYVHTAAQMLSLDRANVTKDQRQLGKIAELSMQFAGGPGALNNMARAYGMNFGKDTAQQVKNSWRMANPWAPPFWMALESAAMDAIRTPGTPFDAGRVSYMFTPDVIMGALWCQLPSGRLLCYPNARIDDEITLYGPRQQISAIKGGLSAKVGETEWPRTRLWKGLLAENVTQAVAADLLRESLRTLVLDHGMNVIGHTHDEILVESSDFTDSINDNAAVMQEVMTTPPAWAGGLPLAVEVGDGYRYGK